jgi:hypothetical protein
MVLSLRFFSGCPCCSQLICSSAFGAHTPLLASCGVLQSASAAHPSEKRQLIPLSSVVRVRTCVARYMRPCSLADLHRERRAPNRLPQPPSADTAVGASDSHPLLGSTTMSRSDCRSQLRPTCEVLTNIHAGDQIAMLLVGSIAQK